MKQLQIGDIGLMAITEEHLKRVLIIEGCICSLEYWDEPTITGIDNTMFSNRIVADYYSLRTADKIKSSEYTFFLDTELFSFHYSKNLYGGALPMRSTEGKRLGLKSLSFLIQCGYNIPL